THTHASHTHRHASNTYKCITNTCMHHTHIHHTHTKRYTHAQHTHTHTHTQTDASHTRVTRRPLLPGHVLFSRPKICVRQGFQKRPGFCLVGYLCFSGSFTN